MEIIKTLTSEQQIKIIPRELLNSVRLYLVDKEQESNVIDEVINVTNVNEFMVVPFTANFFKEGRKYFIKIYNDLNQRIWQGEAFCTDATDLQNYKING